jgi:serine O-acetyltransferase
MRWSPGIPARTVQASKAGPKDQRFVAYGTPTGDIPDPVARALEGLLDEVQSLRARVNALDSNDGAGDRMENVGRDARGEEDDGTASESPKGEC